MKQIKKDIKNNPVSIAAIIAITILESIALLKGINGTLLATSFTVLGGIAGYMIKQDKVMNDGNDTME